MGWTEIEPPVSVHTDRQQDYTRRFAVDAIDVDNFVLNFIQPDYVAGGQVVRVPNATFPGKSWLEAAEVTLEPIDKDDCDDGTTAGYALCPAGYFGTVRYSTLESPDEPALRGIKFRCNFGGELLRMSPQDGGNGGLQWATGLSSGGSTKLTEGVMVHQFIPLEEWQITWEDIALPPWEKIRELRGHVNENTFLGLEPETVLFQGLEAQRNFIINGRSAWTLDYRFSARRFIFKDKNDADATATWNHLPRPDAKAADDRWQKTDPLIYPLSDFADLFKAGTATDIPLLFLAEVGLIAQPPST